MSVSPAMQELGKNFRYCLGLFAKFPYLAS